jgi:hypothetical protein
MISGESVQSEIAASTSAARTGPLIQNHKPPATVRQQMSIDKCDTLRRRIALVVQPILVGLHQFINQPPF